MRHKQFFCAQNIFELSPVISEMSPGKSAKVSRHLGGFSLYHA